MGWGMRFWRLGMVLASIETFNDQTYPTPIDVEIVKILEIAWMQKKISQRS